MIIPPLCQNPIVRKLRHPLTGAIYEIDGEDADLVRVEHEGRVGLFRADGTWASGELRTADPQLCVWVGGRAVAGGALTAPQSTSEE